jgi:hypothetical protein
MVEVRKRRGREEEEAGGRRENIKTILSAGFSLPSLRVSQRGGNTEREKYLQGEK